MEKLDELEIKTCNLCGPKTIDQFYISYISKTGVVVYKDVCKKCYRKRQKENRSPEIDKRRLRKVAINRAKGIGYSSNLLRSYKTGDKAKNRCCDLTKEFIEQQLSNGCSYCRDDVEIFCLPRFKVSRGLYS